MKTKSNNLITNDESDWRYTNQKDYLYGVELVYSSFEATKLNDHEHCVFCWEKFSELKENLYEGYCTIDRKYWICEKCYNDFKYMLDWIV